MRDLIRHIIVDAEQAYRYTPILSIMTYLFVIHSIDGVLAKWVDWWYKYTSMRTDVYCSDWSYVPPTYVRHLKNRSTGFGGTISSGFGGTNAIQHQDETIIFYQKSPGHGY